MTIDEIGDTLPNGFHDSDVVGINIDFVKETAEFLIEVDLCSPYEEVEIASRNGVMKLMGLHYLVFEPPSHALGGSKLWLTADSSDFSRLKEPPSLPSIPESSFQHWFFDSNHNCFIYVAAMGASFSWVEDS